MNSSRYFPGALHFDDGVLFPIVIPDKGLVNFPIHQESVFLGCRYALPWTSC